MMSEKNRILIVAATHLEIESLISLQKEGIYPKETGIDFLVTGIGIANTIFNLTALLKDVAYQRVINVGICGAYNRALELGQVVEVTEDYFADQGIEDGKEYWRWHEAGIGANLDFPYTEKGRLLPSFPIAFLNLAKVVSITSDTVHASEQSIERIIRQFSPDIETMEGAAVFYVCRKLNIDVTQIRAVSNYVGKRNKKEWRIELALDRLTQAVRELIENFKDPANP